MTGPTPEMKDKCPAGCQKLVKDCYYNQIQGARHQRKDGEPLCSHCYVIPTPEATTKKSLAVETPEMKELSTDWQERFDELFVTTIRGGLMSSCDTWQGDVKPLIKLFIQSLIDASYKRGVEEINKELCKQKEHFAEILKDKNGKITYSTKNEFYSGKHQILCKLLEQLNQTHREEQNE